MEIQILHRALQALPGDEPGPSAAHVKELASLVDGDLPLQSFLEQLLPLLCSLFGGSAAVAWMKAHGVGGAVFGVRYQMDKLLSSIAEQKKHERLVQLAWQQRQPLLAEPASPKARVAATSMDLDTAPPGASMGSVNPTGLPLLFGPILHLGEPLALLEIVLPQSSQPLSQSQRQLYLRGIKLVAERVYGGLRQRMAMPAATLNHAVEQLDLLSTEVKSIQQQIQTCIETRLKQFHGWSFASLAENQAFAKMVHQLLDSHGLRVVCPECGSPAILRCLRVGNAKHGAFVYDHYLDSGRTFHGGPTTVPLIRVVNKPARRPALSNPT
jgi:hypothetical protein